LTYDVPLEIEIEEFDHSEKYFIERQTVEIIGNRKKVMYKTGE